jgi:hypothetical protein
MRSTTLHMLVRLSRSLAGEGPLDHAEDRDLLARFADARDEAAFAAILDRHGRLVWEERDGWHVRDAATGKPRGRLPLSARGFGGFRTLASSPDGQLVAAGHHDGTVSLCLTTLARAVAQFKRD